MMKGARYLIYFFYHPQGRLDGYVPHLLSALRPFFDVIHVISNGPLDAGAKAHLSMVDRIQQRPNQGFDVGAYADAIAALPHGALRDLRELTLANHTFFGPMAPFGPVFDWAARQPHLGFWGLSEHAAAAQHPFGRGAMQAHLNSHWITIRQPMLRDPAFGDYWSAMPPIRSYGDSVYHHESRFTAHFNALGYASAAYLPADGAGPAYPAFDRAHVHIPNGFPILKRRLLFHQPVAYADAHETRPAAAIARAPAPLRDLIWQNIAECDPWALYQNADLLVLPASPDRPVRSFDLTLDLPRALSPPQAQQLRQCLPKWANVRLSGKGAASLGLTARPRASVGGPQLIARVAPDGIARFQAGLAHLIPAGGCIAGVADLFDQQPSLGLALPPFSLRRDHLPAAGLLADHAMGWVRADLAEQIGPHFASRTAPALAVQKAGAITCVISTTAELARHTVKLEARYRALAARLGTACPFAAPAKLDHLLAMHATNNTAHHRATFEAGFKQGFDEGFAHGYRDAFQAGFEDGWRKSRAAAPADVRAVS